MFYSQFILAKKGPLGTIWIAAHLERKLRKNQVTETNISVSVDSILFPEVPIALRLSGHLLLGVVRIYSRKVNYLFHDCSEALVKIKQAFHSGAVDLPPEAATAPFHSITLPETFDLDDLELLPDREALFLANSSIDHHVTSREQITLQDPVEDNAYLSSQFGLDERFPDGDNPRLGLDFDEDVIFVKPQAEEEVQEESAILEEDVLPSIQIDDQMEQMDADDIPEKCMPGFAPDLMDLDERQLHEPSIVLPLDQMEVDDRIEPSTDANAINAALDTDVSIARETEAETPAHLASKEHDGVTATELVMGVELTSSKAPSEMLEGETPRPTAADLPASATTVVEEPPADVTEDTLEAKISTAGVGEDALNGGVAEAEPPPEAAVLTEETVQGEVHDKEIMGIDAPPVEMSSHLEGEIQNNSNEQLTEDFPDIEKVRSAVDVRDLEPNVLELADAFGVEKASVEKISDENAQAALQEDRIKSQDVEETPNLKQDPSNSILRASPPSALNLPDFADVPGDDDMLATILGRRTPALRVAPTPSDLPPAKRQKPGPKPGSRKRKIQYDESTVLHGDTMRHQLADTSDSQRVRKRAPCTEHEIWGLEKEAQGQQMFDEPLIPGMCDSIRELYHCIYGVGDAKLPLASVESDAAADAKDARQLENSNSDRAGSPNGKIDKHQLDLQETNEALSLEEENFDELDIYDIQRLCVNGSEEAVGEPKDLDGEVKISEVEVSVAEQNLSTDTGLGLDEEGKETQASEKIDDNHEEQASTLVVEAEDRQASELEETQASVQANVLVENEVDTAVPQPLTEEVQAADIVEIVNNENDLKDKQLEVNEEVGAKEVGPGDGQMDTEPLKEADEIPEEFEKFKVDHTGEDVIESVMDDEAPKGEASVAVNDDNTVQIVDPVQGEEPLVGPSADDEHPVEALGFLTDAKDADGEACDDAEEHDAGYAEEQVQDNSGWSVRTRAVCQYLRVTFETMETSRKEKQGSKLGLERLLQGKTRREAARMFFETLVLKTKDYINVEQGAAFDNIYIAPRSKLMKADL